MSTCPLLEALRSAETSDWLRWVLQADCEYARRARDFYSTSFANIKANKQSSLLRRLAGSDEKNVAAVLAELDCHELLRRLNLAPDFEPSICGQTPDLSFKSGIEFIADVFLTYSPEKTLRDFGNKGEAWDANKPGENRGKKIGDDLAKKASKYEDIQKPLVVFVVLADHRILSNRDVERALFGMTIPEVSHYPRYPNGVWEERPSLTGILLPDCSGVEHYNNLSAVVCCQWFDSQDEHDPDRLLSAYVLHSWRGTALPQDTFSRFGQVIWQSPRDKVWHPCCVGRGDIGAKFLAGGAMTYVSLGTNAPL